MTYSALILLTPMLLGAQIILTMVLKKGEICPGQRGRIHRLLPALGVLWLAVTSVELMAFIVACSIFYFYSKVKIGKTKDEGPLWVLYLSIGLALAFVVIQASQFYSISYYLVKVIEVFLLGSLFAHLNLAIARSRLEAFNKLLPLTGLVSGIVFALILFAQLWFLNEDVLEQSLVPLIFGLGLLIVGLLTWAWHLFSGGKVSKVRLSIALVQLFIACLSLNSLF